MKGNPHWDIFHILSNVFIFGGFIILSSSWHDLWQAQRQHKLATSGLYARMRHPQYTAFIAIMLGFLLQWPTLITLIMFPFMVFMYVRLARHEEADVRQEFGKTYDDWAAVTPAFLPRIGGKRLLPVLILLLVGLTGRPSQAAEDNPYYRSAGGIATYLGIMPAALIKGHSPSHAEATMHGGVPGGAHEYHLFVAIFDSKTGSRISNAAVTMRVSPLGLVGESKALEPMTIGNVLTYGAYFNLPGSDNYDIGVEIKIPGRGPVKVTYRFDHNMR